MQPPLPPDYRKMTRTFGVELEVVAQRDHAVGFLGRILQRTNEANLTRQGGMRGYGACDYSVWQVKSDSSVRGPMGSGLEVVSRVLPANDEGFNEVNQICQILQESNATANKSCGMHVHVDVRDLSLEQLKNVVRAYVFFQDEIDRVLPRSRRNGGYCRYLCNSWNRADFLQRVTEATTVQRLGYAFPQRACVLNLAKWRMTGTLEFRQHSGSAEAAKVLTWAKWCIAFVEKFRNINVWEQAAAPATSNGLPVLIRVAGQGERRMPSRGGARRLMTAFNNGLTLTEADIRRIRGKETATSDYWIKYLATRCGQSFELTSAGWRLAGTARPDAGLNSTPTATDAFLQCFDLFTNSLTYFGRRRAALA